MRWREGRQSQNVEDRRGMSRGGMAIGGGLGGIVILVIALLLGAESPVYTEGGTATAARLPRWGPRLYPR